jgi:DNA-binding NtrC family response regulator
MDYEIKQSGSGIGIKTSSSHVSVLGDGTLVIKISQQPEVTAAAITTDHLVGKPMREVERHYFEAAMKMADGNLKRAAQILGLSFSTVFKRAAKYKGEREREKMTSGVAK